MTNAGESMQEVGPEEARALIAGGAFLLDVREPHEYQIVNLGAPLIPVGQLDHRPDRRRFFAARPTADHTTAPTTPPEGK